MLPLLAAKTPKNFKMFGRIIKSENAHSLFQTKLKNRNFSFRYLYRNKTKGFVSQIDKNIKTAKLLISEKISNRSVEEHKQKYKTIQSVARRIFNFFNFFYRLFTDGQFAKNKLRSAGSKISHEIVHYGHGTRKMYKNIQRTMDILTEFYEHEKRTRLTVWEKKDIIMTYKDLFRVIPLLIIIITPFLEFFLPLLMKIFPGIMPSVFDAIKNIEELKRLLKKKKFRALKIRTCVGFGSFEKVFSPVSDEELEKEHMLRILEKIKSGDNVSNDQLLEVAVMFDDFTDLGTNDDKTVRRLCKYMGISTNTPYDWYKNKLLMHFWNVEKDDKVLIRQDLSLLPTRVLVRECQERGMAVSKLDRNQLLHNLRCWLDISINHHVPLALMVYSTSFSHDQSISLKAVAETIKTSEREVIDEMIEEESFKFPEEIIKQAQQSIKQKEPPRKQTAQTKKEAESIELHGISEKLGTLMGDTSLPLEEETIQQLTEKCEEMENNMGGSGESMAGIMKDVLTYPEATNILVKWLGIEEKKAMEIVLKLDLKKDGKIDLKELKSVNEMTDIDSKY